MQNLGAISPEALRALKDAKLLILPRPDGNVWVDPSDMEKAKEIIAKLGKRDKPNEQIYRFHGFTVRMPKDIRIEQRVIGAPMAPSSNKKVIYIHELSKPANGLDSSDKTKTLKRLKIKGQEIKIESVMFTPAYSGIVMCDDDGIPIFEVTPNNVFVLFDTNHNAESTKKVYESMLMFAIVLSNHEDTKSAQIWSEIWRKQAPEREKLEIKQFEEIVSGSLKQEVRDLEKAVATAEAKITEYQKLLFNEVRSMDDNGKRLDAFKSSMGGNMEQRAKEEWEKLKVMERNNAVRNVRVNMDNISFVTRKIVWTPPEGGHVAAKNVDGVSKRIKIDWPVEIGEFEITVKMGRNFEVRVQNITKTLEYDASTWHHPHVRDGSVCKGNMTEVLPKFAAQRDFQAIMMVMLKWLENVDVLDTWGTGIYYWAVEDKKRVELEEKVKKQEAEKKAADEAKKATEAAVPVPAGVACEKKEDVASAVTPVPASESL